VHLHRERGERPGVPERKVVLLPVRRAPDLHRAGGSGNTWSNTTGDTATLSFEGSYVALNSTAYNGQGIMSVSVDGGAATSVGLYRNSSQGVNAPVFTADGLDPTATHILKVTVTVTKNPSSQGNWASLVDAIIA
jgi:hypothetical protein